MKIVKTLGLLLFVIGFTVFNLSFFLGSYKLTPAIVKTQITEELHTSVLEETSAINDQSVGSSFEFISSIRRN